MYVVIKEPEAPQLIVEPNAPKEFNVSQAEMREWLDPSNLREALPGLDASIERNRLMKKIVAEKDSGKPGHYYGRDIMIEGEVPLAVFLAAALEFDGDPDWFKDDKKFQDYMSRHRETYSWF